MNRSLWLAPLDPDVVRSLAHVSRSRLGELLHANAIHAGLRLADGVRYRPRPESVAREVNDSAKLRSSLRLALRDFLALAESNPQARELPLEAWHELAGASELWSDPSLSAAWAAQLMPHNFDPRLTHAVNQLRKGQARPALHEFQGALSGLARTRSTQSTLLRNSAAAYELIGDSEASHWCARRAFLAAPWCEAGLLSFLVYSLLTRTTSDILHEVQLASRGYCGLAPREQLWSMLQALPQPLLTRLSEDDDLEQRIQDLLFLRD